jgi:hypothetical protein
VCFVLQFKYLYSHLKYPRYGDDPFEGTSISEQAKKELETLLGLKRVRVGIENIKKGEAKVDFSSRYVY